ncbi:hypothetical protein ODJ79_00665 [Actinoplanes sp. KI2]|uniref:hypothetical protein n=1 Tax=Actinoplanes sp. KI2 TaxID=2983315 RepID=UPI0021D61044|nr:hypothetical protein [Actinoplanes sp. KI2]MCU7722218.1 hypothetical protein [Actinoplanes sp. KI2]
MAGGTLREILARLGQRAGETVERISEKVGGTLREGAGHARDAVHNLSKADRGAGERLKLAGRSPRERFTTALDERGQTAYSGSELDDIRAHGDRLGMTPEESADFVKAGAIPKTGKKYPTPRLRIEPDELKAQMDNWATEVKPRGYPYHFESAEQFEEFGGKLNELSEQYGLPRGRTIVQGSALRTPAAKDVDVAVIVPDEEFDNYAAQCADGITARARPRNQAGLLADLEDHAQKGFVPQYMFDRPAGATETFGQASHRLLEEYGVPDLDFSVMKQSSAMALYPHLDITREQR